MTLLCVRCKTDRPIEHFKMMHSRSRGINNKPSLRQGRDSWCKACHAAAQKGYVAKKDPEQHKQDRRASHYRTTYGITLGEYEKLNSFRSGECWICKRPGIKRGLNIDHDHRTGLIRGLICHQCNRGLRWFRDNPLDLRAAAAYLETSDQLMAAALSTDVTGAHQPVGE